MRKELRRGRVMGGGEKKMEAQMRRSGGVENEEMRI